VAIFRFSSSRLATVDEVLGLRAPSQFDHCGRPLAEVFADTADLPPYRAMTPSVPLDEVNPRKAKGRRNRRRSI
jgi:hypothetical protein